MSGDVIAFSRPHRADIWRELARQLREAADWSERMGARGMAARQRREAARLEHDAAACERPAAGRGA